MNYIQVRELLQEKIGRRLIVKFEGRQIRDDLRNDMVIEMHNLLDYYCPSWRSHFSANLIKEGNSIINFNLISLHSNYTDSILRNIVDDQYITAIKGEGK